jgi:hypothetical protein
MSAWDGTEPITNDEEVIDSRQVIERIAFLQGGADDLDQDERDELATLLDLQDQAEPYCPDWRYGEALVRDDAFEDYARQLAEDLGDISKDAPWPLSYIDWEAAAAALQEDYTEVQFDGVTYWTR